MKLLKMYRAHVKIHGKMYLSREFSITCPVGGSLVSDPGHLWAASFRTDFGKLCSELYQASRYVCFSVWVPVSDVFFISKTTK